MNFELYDDTALARDLPEYGLRRGDIVRPVDRHRSVDGIAGCTVEVINALGETLKVIAVPASVLEPLRNDEILCVRPL